MTSKLDLNDVEKKWIDDDHCKEYEQYLRQDVLYRKPFLHCIAPYSMFVSASCPILLEIRTRTRIITNRTVAMARAL